MHHGTVSGASLYSVRCFAVHCPVHHDTVSGASRYSVRCITVLCPAELCHHTVVPESLTALLHLLNISMKAFTLTVAVFTKVFRKETSMWIQNVKFRQQVASHFLTHVPKFMDTITKARIFLSTSEFCSGPLKAFPRRSFCASQTFQYFSNSVSHEEAFFPFRSDDVRKFCTQVLEWFWICLIHGFHLALNQPAFYAERSKDYLRGVKERNVIDAVFSRLVSPPWFKGARAWCSVRLYRVSGVLVILLQHRDYQAGGGG